MKEITESELVKRHHHGTVYICRSCYDNRRKIKMLNYIDGGKNEIIYTMCDDCMKIMEHCSQCKKPKY